MKKQSNLYSGLGICALIVIGVWWYNVPSGSKLTLPNVASAWVHAVAGPTRQPVKATLTVAPNYVRSWTWDIAKPTRLYGSWSSSGITAKIKGATDDTLVAFELRGPNDEVIKRWGHAAGGNFDVEVKAPGRYTFVIDNAGILRSSDRKVSIDAVAESQ